MPRSRTTIGDIAERAGVSKGAVSFALNGKPGVSESTRERILRIADEMQWRPHSAARALGGSRADVIGLVLARPARTMGVEPFFAQLISGIQAGISAAGIALHMLIVENTEAEMATYQQWWNEHRVDGVVLVDPLEHDPRISLLEELQLPAVVVGGPSDHGSLPAVWVDDREAMTLIVDYLAAIGHRRIAHVAGMPEFIHTQRRISTLSDSVDRLGLDWAQTYTTDFSDSQGAAATRRALTRHDRPTAIIFDSDVMAVAGLGVAVEMGVSVPDQLSIAAFDDSVLTQLVHPPITALTRDTYRFGELVATTLLESIDATLDRSDIAASMPILTVRGSTAPPADTAPPSPR